MENHYREDRNELIRFAEKLGLVVLVVLALLLLKATFNVLLMVLAAVLIALFFHGFAGIIGRRLKLKHKWNMVLSICGTFLFLFLLFWLIGAKVQSQINQLSQKMPSMIQQGKSQLQQSQIGQQILNQSSGQNSKKLMDSAKKFFSSTFGVLGDLCVILFLAIFFTAEPKTYRSGILALVPAGGKEKADDLLNKLAHNLKSWFKGKLFSMAVVAILTGIGLSIIGVPMFLALAVIAGILNFIPNFGPIIAMVPAVLVGLTQGPNVALMVAGLYIFIQVLESNLITPMIQKKLVSIPPAMIILGQLVVGSLTGYLGIILATPVVLIVMTLVNELYVHKQE